MSFHVGQRVVCVDDSPVEGRIWYDGKPQISAVYTIVGIEYGRYGPYQTFLFAELSRQSGRGYAAWRFRPVIERKTDISILTALLNPANHKHLEGV